EVIAEPLDLRHAILEPPWSFGSELRCDLIHSGLRPLERKTGLEPCDDPQVVTKVIAADPVLRRNDVRHPDLGGSRRADRVGEGGRHHTEDLEVPSLAGQVLTESLRCA